MSATTAGCGSSVGMNFGKEYYKMIVNAGYRGKVAGAAPKFTYTGQYNVRKDGVVELLTSGTIVFLEPKVIDVFMVGGGGSGKQSVGGSDNDGYGGGGGGYTRTIKRVTVPANSDITVSVGAGADVGAGNSSAFSSYTVSGGAGANGRQGGAGGSGGGGGVLENSDYGTGGSDGNNGENGYGTYVRNGGTGQGFSAREFGEANGKLYGGGGGGGRYMSAQSPVVSAGGSGGGGAGAWHGAGPTLFQASSAGVANTGGGGGGIARGNNHTAIGAPGGSGIVCFREAQELPGLAGTWVLNERLYPSQTGAAINENINFTAVTPSGDFTGVKISVGYTATSTAGVYLNQSTAFTTYQFSNNRWVDSSRAISQITFPTGATASDEFRAWLASNATKQ